MLSIYREQEHMQKDFFLNLCDFYGNIGLVVFNLFTKYSTFTYFFRTYFTLLFSNSSSIGLH